MISILLIRPKYERNVAMVVRLAQAFGAEKVIVAGHRYVPAKNNGEREPRELRMFGHLLEYRDIGKNMYPKCYIVGVENIPNTEALGEFIHPPGDVCYVFGPEDGGLSAATLRHCHRFVRINSKCSLNLSTAVGIVLWNRSTAPSFGMA